MRFKGVINHNPIYLLVENDRVLDTPSYDLILGMDWISEMGPITIDGKKVFISLNHMDKLVNLKIEVVAEVKLIDNEVDLQKEKEKGS